MNEFSIGDAAFAGLRLLGRNTAAACVWAALAVGAFAVICLLFGGGIIGFIAAIAQAGGKPDPAAILGMVGSIGGFYLLLIVSSIVLNAVIACAIYRAELHPEQSQFFFLRFGASEGWLMLVSIVRGILMFVLQLAFSIPIAIVSLALGAAGGVAAGHEQAAAGGLGAYMLANGVLRLIMYGFVIWVTLRLSMAGPMTFAEQKFRLFESWTMTRGISLRLLLVALVVFVTGFATLVVLGAIGFAGGAAIWSSFPHPSDLKAFLAQPSGDTVRFLAPYLEWAVVLFFVGDIVMLPVSVAPWAHVYRRLRPPVDVDGVFE